MRGLEKHRLDVEFCHGLKLLWGTLDEFIREYRQHEKGRADMAFGIAIAEDAKRRFAPLRGRQHQIL